MTQTEAPAVDAPPTLYWSGPLAMEDTPTGDGRRILPEALTWRDLPLPLMFQSGTPEGVGNPHAGAEWAGRITVLWRDDAIIHGAGTIDSGETGAMLGRLLADGPVGVSVDLDDVTSETECLEVDEDGECVDAELRLVKGRVMGVTGTPFPALPNAQIALVDAEAFAVLEAAHGELAAPEPHEYVDSGDGTCEICGLPEAEHDAAKPSGPAPRRPPPPPASIIAGGGPLLPPESWFEDPDLPGPTAITITDDGRVYGHAARWGQPHIALSGRTAPKSASAYAYFRTGARRASCECPDLGGQVEVPTGTITLGTSHNRDLAAGARETLDHYEHTGLAVADVAAGEDEHGIWIAGALRPDVSDEKIVALRGASLSGDWRWIGGKLELVAVLAVNVPGFPMPRETFHVSDGRETALVAAGIVPPRGPVVNGDGVAARIGYAEAKLERLSRVVALLEPQALAALGSRFGDS